MEVICIDVSMVGLEGGHPRVYTDVFPSITAREYKEPRMIMEVRQIGNCMVTGKRENPNQGRVYDSSGLCPTITNMQGGGRQPMIIDAISTNGTDVSGCIRATYYKNGERNIVENVMNKKGYEGVVETVKVKQATKEGYIECKVGGGSRPQFP